MNSSLLCVPLAVAAVFSCLRNCGNRLTNPSGSAMHATWGLKRDFL